MVHLDDEAVKESLRRGVRANIIHGWYRHQPLKGKEWVVNPMNGPCVSYTPHEIRGFCEMLDAATQ